MAYNFNHKFDFLKIIIEMITFEISVYLKKQNEKLIVQTDMFFFRLSILLEILSTYCHYYYDTTKTYV